MKFTPRMRLHGRQASESQIIQEISQMVQGYQCQTIPTTNHRNSKDVRVCRKTACNYIKRIENMKKASTGRFILPKVPAEKKFRRFNKDHAITSEPLVAEWI